MDKILQFLKNIPAPWRWIAAALVAVLVAFWLVFSVSACSTIRTTLNSSGTVSTTVKQSVLDSTKIELSIFKPVN